MTTILKEGTMLSYSEIQSILGDQSESLLSHQCQTIDKNRLHIPSPTYVDDVFSLTNRNNQVLRNLQSLYNHGRLAGTGYLSILPVDQGIEHSAGASFAPNPDYFDPENIVKLAIEGGCNAVASTLGVLGLVSRKYAHKIPFIVKINHNEFLTYPNTFDQIMFASIDQAADMGAAAVGATIYFGSEESGRQIQEVAQAFEYAHSRGLATILWCYLRNSEFKKDVNFIIDIDKGKSIDGDMDFLELPFGGRTAQDVYDKLKTVNYGISPALNQVIFDAGIANLEMDLTFKDTKIPVPIRGIYTALNSEKVNSDDKKNSDKGFEALYVFQVTSGNKVFERIPIPGKFFKDLNVSEFIKLIAERYTFYKQLLTF